LFEVAVKPRGNIIISIPFYGIVVVIITETAVAAAEEVIWNADCFTFMNGGTK